jgi:uncharacterized membrane protein
MAKNQQLILAFFDSEAIADGAVNELKNWDKASKDIKLGSIGVLVKDDKGKIKTHKLGSRRTALGAVLGVLAAALTGGTSLLVGAVLGGIVGAFFHKGLGVSKDDLARIGSQLDGGKAALAVLATNEEAGAVTAKLVELGGTPETHEVTEEAVAQAEAATEAAPEAATEAAPEAATETASDASDTSAAPEASAPAG